MCMAMDVVVLPGWELSAIVLQKLLALVFPLQDSILVGYLWPCCWEALTSWKSVSFPLDLWMWILSAWAVRCSSGPVSSQMFLWSQ